MQTIGNFTPARSINEKEKTFLDYGEGDRPFVLPDKKIGKGEFGKLGWIAFEKRGDATAVRHGELFENIWRGSVHLLLRGEVGDD